MKNGLITVIASIVLFAAGYFVSEFTSKPEIKTKTVKDTVYQPQPEIDTIKKAKLDTVYIPKIDTVYIPKIDTISETKKDTIYKVDTVQVAKDTTQFKQGKLEVKYYFPPANYFRYNWQPKPRRTIIKIRKIKIEPKWYENKYLWGVAGLVGGIVIMR